MEALSPSPNAGNKRVFQQLCLEEPTIPLFCQAWWLDLVTPETYWTNWDVCLVRHNGQIVAALPYVYFEKWGLLRLGQPSLTQYLGPWIKKVSGKYVHQLSTQKEWLQELLKDLPDFGHYQQNWNYNYRNWQPFYWNGYEQTTLYTYILPDLSNLDSIWNDFQENIRREIRKAQNRFKLVVRTDLSFDDFWLLHYKTFERQKLSVPYTKALAQKIYTTCLAKNCGRLLIAEDPQGQRHAGVFIIWDQHSAYYLFGGGDPDLRHSGATSLCMWEAIRFAANVTTQFDFEGSMIQAVERYFRAFGALQTPYFRISKTPSKLLKTKALLYDLRKTWLS